MIYHLCLSCSGGRTGCQDSRGFGHRTSGSGGGGEWGMELDTVKGKTVYITTLRVPIPHVQNPHRNLGNLLWKICMCREGCFLVSGCWCFWSKAFLILASAECEAWQLTQTYSILLSGPDTPIRIMYSGFLHKGQYQTPLTLLQVL